MAEKREKLKELEKEIQKPGLWQNKEKAVRVTQELSKLREETVGIDKLKEELEEIKELDDEAIAQAFEEKVEQEELKVFLSGKYDWGSAILSIYAGAGGQDAQDWATMLLRMFERYCLLKGFQAKVLHQSFGEAGGPEGRIGTKSATLEIRGKYAFGLLKRESGVHRLVRLSPFSSKSLRHTSFASVEVLPLISSGEESEIKVKPEDLRVDTYRASGPGGQYVNKRETAVRITHLPSGVTVSCQSERLQGTNKEKAMNVLISKLYQLEEEKKKKELKKIKGDTTSVSWGNQIRSYVLHPYKMAKDLRTGVETSKVEEVLDGNLDSFVEAEIKLNAQ